MRNTDLAGEAKEKTNGRRYEETDMIGVEHEKLEVNEAYFTGGSDSDTNSDEVPEYYQPISAVDDGEDYVDMNSDDDHSSNFVERLLRECGEWNLKS
ncbi:hypothetical protein O6P43_020405 [Quillaja saponaria]|uniref:Uncharacterized protein n=1 Tax=Quillaja saponaria TaxID=32244 RepID=A0AAD7LL10_QUISA|nr:hypothetical protein O6P43_020405 [Quillaja saponaria]